MNARIVAVFIVAILAAAAGVILYDTIAASQVDPSAIPKDIAAANNAFAVDFYRQVSDNDENIFFSPAGIYTTFSLLYEGARDDTASQMEDVFGFETDEVTRHNNTARMMASVNRDDPHAILNLANALWFADWFEPHNSYLDIARGTYLANAERVSFPGDVAKINRWASDNTNGKIDKIADPGDIGRDTAMVITNAIYFKGIWDTQFPEENTRESDFWKDGTNSIRAEFMSIFDMFDYTSTDDMKMLKMPYTGDRLSMLVLMPRDRDGIGQLEEKISAEMIQKWQRDLRETELIVEIPKFEMRTSYDLNSILMSLGMTDVFDENRADLLGITTQPGEAYTGTNLYVTKASQAAYVKVNEEGTEAVAVTAAVAKPVTKQPEKPNFVADRPFVFIIQDDKSGAILFMGRVSDPTA